MNIKCSIITIIILILSISVVLATTKECKGVMHPRDVADGCMIISTWNYENPCNTYNITVWNSTPSNVVNYTMSDYGATGKCNATWHITDIGSYTLNSTSGETASIIIEGETEMELAIIIAIGILILLGAFFTFYLENSLKFVFLLGTVLLGVFGLNVAANLASSAGVSAVVVGLLWLAYRMGLYSFFALFFYVLIKLLMELRIRKNPAPDMGSPLKRFKAERKERKARKHGIYS